MKKNNEWSVKNERRQAMRGNRSYAEGRKNRRMLATWLSYDDLHRLVVSCLTTPVLGHTIIYGTSDNAVSWYDNRLARHVGYRAKDSADPFRSTVFAHTQEPDVTDPADVYQGGAFIKTGPL